MPVDNVTACQSWSYCTLSNGHFHFWPKKGAPDLFTCVHVGPMYVVHIYIVHTCHVQVVPVTNVHVVDHTRVFYIFPR